MFDLFFDLLDVLIGSIKIQSANLYSLCFNEKVIRPSELNLDRNWIPNIILPFIKDIHRQFSELPILEPKTKFKISHLGMEIEHQIWSMPQFTIYDCYPTCKLCFTRLNFEEFLFLISALFNEIKIVFISSNHELLASIL